MTNDKEIKDLDKKLFEDNFKGELNLIIRTKQSDRLIPLGRTSTVLRDSGEIVVTTSKGHLLVLCEDNINQQVTITEEEE